MTLHSYGCALIIFFRSWRRSSSRLSRAIWVLLDRRTEGHFEVFWGTCNQVGLAWRRCFVGNIQWRSETYSRDNLVLQVIGVSHLRKCIYEQWHQDTIESSLMPKDEVQGSLFCSLPCCWHYECLILLLSLWSKERLGRPLDLQMQLGL